MATGVAVVAYLLAASGGNQAPVGCRVAGYGSTFALTPNQAQNAAIEAAVAYRLGLPDHAVSVALATSLQESKLINLPYGDADSVGLFQQRPSQGWGTTAELLDPVYASTAFYRGLARVPGWQSMPVTQAAQSVQRSATPDAYAAWEPEARALAAALTGEVPAGLTCHLPTFTGRTPAPGALSAAAVREFGQDLLGVDVTEKTGWRVATWLEGHASAYHIREIRFAGRAWTASSGSWSDRPAGTAGSPVTGVVTFTYAHP